MEMVDEEAIVRRKAYQVSRDRLVGGMHTTQTSKELTESKTVTIQKHAGAVFSISVSAKAMHPSREIP